MNFLGSTAITLEHFEGPLDLLLYLTQQKEIELYEISIREIVEQYWRQPIRSENSEIDRGAEFLGAASTLMLMKSCRLLPAPTIVEEEAQEGFLRLEMWQQILDYCQFRSMAKNLLDKEDEQAGRFLRGLPSNLRGRSKRQSGLEQLTLLELADILQQALRKSQVKPGDLIREEMWRVGDKIAWIEALIHTHPVLSILELFSPDKPQGELIVTFLALLEMMKQGAIKMETSTQTEQLCIMKC